MKIGTTDDGFSESQAESLEVPLIQESRKPMAARSETGVAADIIRGSGDSAAGTRQSLAQSDGNAVEEQRVTNPHSAALLKKLHEVALALMVTPGLTVFIGFFILLNPFGDSFLETVYFVGLCLSCLITVETARSFRNLCFKLEPQKKTFINSFISLPKCRATRLVEVRSLDWKGFRDDAMENLKGFFPWCWSLLYQDDDPTDSSATAEEKDNVELHLREKDHDKLQNLLFEAVTDEVAPQN
ncbi:hypothetical protein ACA910_018021 [Epithemia clementina (nom. ined.)]